MAENSLELRLQCLELASRSHVPADSIPGLAAQFLAFALHDSPERAEYQHKLDVLARAIHDLAHHVKEGFDAMSAATDRLTASVAANTTATDAAVAAFEAGSTSPALEATINAQSDIVDANTAKLAAATPPPPVV